MNQGENGYFNEFSNFFKSRPEKKPWNLKIFLFETSSQKGMIWQIKKKVDFSSLIFDSRNCLAASPKSGTLRFTHNHEVVPFVTFITFLAKCGAFFSFHMRTN